MSFYQKFRPQKFSDIIGQDHIATSLSGAILSNRLAHAYLFTGPRGLGKTSIARILAKAVNCLNRVETEFEPCGKCQNCTEITAGNSLDVIEIDAASNRGIDEIRDLREKIKFGPSNSKYKIYIIDEVHMLTEPAFNALLKTIEEPPAHAIFILATTELHKVPLTIISRCQKFDFRRASSETVGQKLKKIAAKEKINITPGAINLIATLAEGSFRDGESLLDQIASGLENKEITAEIVEQTLGLSPRQNLYKFFACLISGEKKAILSHLEAEYAAGRDLKQLGHELVEVSRSLLLSLAAGKEIGPELSDIAKKFNIEELVYLLEKLVEAGHEQKIAVLPQLPLEMVALEFITKFKNGRVEDKKVVIEDSIESPAKSVETVIDSEVKEVNKAEIKDPTVAVGQDKVVAINDKKWTNFLEGLKPLNHSLYSILGEAKVLTVGKSELRLGVKFKFYVDRINDKSFKKSFDELTEKVFGQKLKVTAEVIKEEKKTLPKRQEKELLDDTMAVFEVE